MAKAAQNNKVKNSKGTAPAPAGRLWANNVRSSAGKFYQIQKDLQLSL